MIVEEIDAVVTNEFVGQIIKNSENLLTIPELVEIIKTETNKKFIRRKINERLRQIKKSGLFCLEERMIDYVQHQYARVIVLN